MLANVCWARFLREDESELHFSKSEHPLPRPVIKIEICGLSCRWHLTTSVGYFLLYRAAEFFLAPATHVSRVIAGTEARLFERLTGNRFGI